MQQDFNVQVQLVHYPLHPDTPAEGLTLQEQFSCGPDEIKAKNIQMKQLLEAEGLEFKYRNYTYNSRLAQGIAVLARNQMKGSTIHDQFYEAYFIDGRNIGDIDVIIDAVKSIGLDEGNARAVIEERRYKYAVDLDWKTLHQYGVKGVQPTSVTDE